MRSERVEGAEVVQCPYGKSQSVSLFISPTTFAYACAQIEEGSDVVNFEGKERVLSILQERGAIDLQLD